MGALLRPLQPDVGLMVRNFIRSHRTPLIVAGCLAAAAMGLLYIYVEPSSGFYPRCSFKMLTGLSCPGCGSQRALHALFAGDLRAAFSYNALFIIELPLLALLAFSGLAGSRAPRLRRFLGSRAFILSILATIIIWTIVRNILDV